MATKLSDLPLAERQRLASSGVAYAGDIGGTPRNTYYTPDGRTIKAIPQWRLYRINGQPGEFRRDANLDNGWLLSPPDKPKPYCGGCDKWHDTKTEVTKCIAKKKSLIERWAQKTYRKEGKPSNNGDEIASLKADVAKLTQMMEMLLKQKE